MRKFAFLIGLLAAAGLAPAEAKLNVFACEPEWAALTTELGGDNVDVYSATTGGQDPHQVQARPSLIAKARKADLAVCTGAELEIGWMPQIVRQSANSKIDLGQPGYFEATSFIDLKEKPTSLDRANGDIHAYGNPHIQTDPRNIAVVAKALAAKLAEMDPANAATYQSRLADFETRWNAAIAKWTAEAAPLKGVPIAVQHKSWPYLEDWLGLKEVVALEPKPGVPPNSGYLATVIQTLQAQPVKMIIRAAYEDPRSSEFITSKIPTKAIELPFTVGGNDEAKDLFSLYDNTLNLMLGALQQ
ncbi:MAG: zinc ABC transporter substrate-binding protein [Parvularculaceae bacterium]